MKQQSRKSKDTKVVDRNLPTDALLLDFATEKSTKKQFKLTNSEVRK